MNDRRKEQLSQWIAKRLSIEARELQPVSGDASFRRYFRFNNQSRIAEKTCIAVDAPPAYENCEIFDRISKILLSLDLNIPIVHEIDLEDGFMLLSDLGDTLYLDQLDNNTSEHLYPLAIDAIVTMQSLPPNKLHKIPAYHKQLLQDELQLFKDWFISRHLKLSLSTQENKIVNDVFKELVDSALAQPQVFCHADFHSRNLMICETDTPGIIDFQDAVIGPVSFDLVSLLKDCYISWSREQVERWCQYYFDQAAQKDIINSSFSDFIHWFDLMGLHRHIRVLGIFTRLNYRDGKAGYLDDLPLTFNYVIDTIKRYPQFNEFAKLLKYKVQPKLLQ